MRDRENALREWLAHTLSSEAFIVTAPAGDASFRRYFRIQYNGLTRVVMDAPPGKENLEPFIRIAETLRRAKVHTPEILAINEQQGFLMLSDYGDQILLERLQLETVNRYYLEALQTLFQIQECPLDDPGLSSFDTAFMLNEMELCLEWFFKTYLLLDLSEEEHQLIQNTFHWIAREVSQQPLVLIHRDYHSRNLMLVPDSTQDILGVIDFQDAMRGPVTYDLVSLLKDCYISWPRETVLGWVSFFHDHSPQTSSYSLPELIRAFDLCGLQRHLKVLGVFCRLHVRDAKSRYLTDLPLTLKYVLECAKLYEELHPFFHFLQKRVYLP